MAVKNFRKVMLVTSYGHRAALISEQKIDQTMIETSNHTLVVAPSERHSPPVPEAKQENGGDRGMFKSVCRLLRRGDKKNLEPVIELAVEIARDGREGRRIGMLFTFGDADAVLKHP
jgi:DNA integrity scanning protein DisA with diadenylate cyclase activity